VGEGETDCGHGSKGLLYLIVMTWGSRSSVAVLVCQLKEIHFTIQVFHTRARRPSTRASDTHVDYDIPTTSLEMRGLPGPFGNHGRFFIPFWF
jgi:hypothetical protein